MGRCLQFNNRVESEVDQFLTVARRLVRDVCPRIREAVAADSRHPKTKADGSFVTETDIAVENYFTEEFRKAFPSVPVLGEEAAADECAKGSRAPREYYADFMQSPQQIVIDPIDGTKNFVEGKAEFCIAAALTSRTPEGIWPLAGLVAIPVKGVMYWCDQTDVYRQEIESAAITRVERTSCATARLSVNSKDRAWLAEHTFEILHPWVSSGSSVHDFLGTALGELQGSMVCKQRLWDLMAPLAIAERLGCGLVDFSTGEPVLSVTPSDLSPDLVHRPWGLMRRMMIVGKDVRVSDLIRAK
jgi:fructose-1,6-bisphosphatase/inositol monophosphatase family enzyme